MLYDAEIINKKICLKIKMERTKRGWSQEKLSEYCDMSKNAIGNIEQCKNTPKICTLLKIAEAFGITVSELTDISKVDL
ncbi:helix-turn-helix transcriptional regulator [bacterium]|nr:helix-turn-helix transcriptional regulator [bacterium]